MKIFITIIMSLGSSVMMSQNAYFYECRNILNDYYKNKDYKSLYVKWHKIDITNALAQDIYEFAEIALTNNDTTSFISNIEYLAYNYGFDYKKIYNKDFLFGNKTDCLLLLWHNNHNNIKDINNLLDAFIVAEKNIYQNQRQYEKSDFKRKIDSLFDVLLMICSMQGNFPNTFDNGYFYEISIPVGHILSVLPETIIDKSKKLKPFLDISFFGGKISNSIFFLIDRLIYSVYKKQLFGCLDSSIEIFDSSENISHLKSKYLFDKNKSAIEVTKNWMNFYNK